MSKRLLVVFVVFLALVSAARADSPLTSTSFWRAYTDVPEVRTAHDIERLNTKLGLYLLSSAPIDRKAAVINAFSWNYHGRQNAILFRDILSQKYKVAPSQVDAKLTPEESFCLGYLTALDDYFHPEKARPFLTRARAHLPRSFTVAMIDALVKAQASFAHFERVWAPVGAVLDDRRLTLDMRPGARDIIVEYMRGYRKYAR